MGVESGCTVTTGDDVVDASRGTLVSADAFTHPEAKKIATTTNDLLSRFI